MFANISGMISILPDGTIHSINQNFATQLFGYTEMDLIGQVSAQGVGYVGWGEGRGEKVMEI